MIRHSARRWMMLLALAGSLGAVTPAGAETPVPPFAWAAFGLTGVGR
jgi:hypothetical protein